MYEPKFMERCIELSRRALAEPGTEPFGSVVVIDGKIVGEGLNHSRAKWDPTSHGETEAIRNACANLQCMDLSEAELYTSCEPCTLCVSTMNIVGIRKLYYAANIVEAGVAFEGVTVAARHPIDCDLLTSECGKPVGERKMPAEQHMSAAAVQVLEAWAAPRRG